MRRASLFTVCLIGLWFAGVQAQEYVLAWEHTGPVDLFKVTLYGKTHEVIPEHARTGPTSYQFQLDLIAGAVDAMVEACNRLGVCASSERLVIPVPNPPTNLQVGMVGTRVPATPPPVAPPAPTVSNLFPDQGAVGIAVDVTITCTGTHVGTYRLEIGTANPPTTGPEPISTCSFDQALANSTTYYYTIEVCNITACVTSAVTSFTTAAAGGGGADLLTDGGDVYTTTGWRSIPAILPQGAADTGIEAFCNGSAVTTQTDIKTVWSDGSIRDAQVTFDITTAGTTICNIREDLTPASGTITPTLPSNTYVEVTVYPLGGSSSVHRATMPTSWASCDAAHYSGPLMRECRFYERFDNSPSGFAQGLTAYFDARCFNDNECRIDLAVNNMERSTVAGERGPIAFSVDFKVNNVSVSGFPKGSAPTTLPCEISVTNGSVAAGIATCTAHGITGGGGFVRVNESGNSAHGKISRVLRPRPSDPSNQLEIFFGFPITSPVVTEHIPHIQPYGTRWRAIGQTSGYADATDTGFTPDLSSLYAAKAVPRYLPTISNTSWPFTGAGTICDIQIGPTANMPVATANEYNWCWDILGPAHQEMWADSPSGREDIGFMPGPHARYLVHKTDILRDIVMRYADLAGSWSKVHNVHAGTMSMMDITDNSNLSDVNCTANNCVHGAAQIGPMSAENTASHQPAYSYVPWLLTGDRYHADELMFWANWGIASGGPGVGAYSRAATGMVGTNEAWGMEARATAWGLRDIVDAANYLPDGHEHKSYFATWTQTNLTALDALGAASDPNGDATLGAMFVGWRQNLGNPGQQYISLWQNTYVALVVHHVMRQGGFTGGATIRNRIVDYIVKLYTSAPDFVADDAPIANFFAVQEGPTYADFANMAQLYEYHYGTTGLGTNPPRRTASAISINACNAYAPHTRMAVVVAVAAGRPNAQAALDLLNAQPILINTCMANPTWKSISGATGDGFGLASMP